MMCVVVFVLIVATRARGRDRIEHLNDEFVHASIHMAENGRRITYGFYIIILFGCSTFERTKKGVKGF